MYNDRYCVTVLCKDILYTLSLVHITIHHGKYRQIERHRHRYRQIQTQTYSQRYRQMAQRETINLSQVSLCNLKPEVVHIASLNHTNLDFPPNIHRFLYPPIHSSNYSCIHSLICLFIYSLTHFARVIFYLQQDGEGRCVGETTFHLKATNIAKPDFWNLGMNGSANNSTTGTF